MADLVQLSKYLSLILRHRAKDFGLQMDENGFTDLAPIWAMVEDRFRGLYTRTDLEMVVAGDSNGKKRFEIMDNRIRAMYGHTRVDVTYPPAVPPETLYHGTSHQVLKQIRKHGLLHMRRQYVHMTNNLARAQRTGGRHDEIPAILVIHAAEAHRAGVEFYHPEEEHWLAKSIPPEFIEFPESRLS